MEISRRKFIGNTSVATIGLTFTNSLFGQSVSPFLTGISRETLLEKLVRAAVLRKGGTSSRNSRNQMQNLSDAMDLYHEVILMDAEEIRAYDGMRKIHLQRKYAELEALQVYSPYLSDHLGHPVFAERVAKEYMRLALGNKKFANQLSNPQELLTAASRLFLQAQNADSRNTQFATQYQKAESKIADRADSLDARDNPKLKELKKINRRKFKQRFDHLTAPEAKALFDKLRSKKPNSDRDMHIREIHKSYIGKLVKEQQIGEAVSELSVLLQYSGNEAHALKMARKICGKHSLHDDLEKMERANEKQKGTFWSKIALFDVLLKKYLVQQPGRNTELPDLLSQAAAKANSFGQSFEISTRMVKLSLAQHQLADAAASLGRLADSISGIKSAHAIDRFNVLCVKYYRDMNNLPNAVMTINYALGQNGLPPNDFLLEKIKEVNRHRLSEKPIHNYRLNYLRNQLFH